MNLITQYDCVDSVGAPAACKRRDAAFAFANNKRQPKLGHS